MTKRMSIVLLAGLLAVGFFFSSCERKTDDEGPRVIGISKIVSHPALDAVEQGIQDELAEQGLDFTFDLQNANGDISAAAQIASKFRNDRVAYAVGIATPTSQALVNEIRNIPVIFAAITDPVGAGLTVSAEGSGANVAGYSDMTPVAEQLSILKQMKDVQRLGHVYSSGEANAVALAEIARDAAAAMGIEFVEATVTNSAEVRQATQSIASRVDAIYVSTDNTVVSALSALVDVANNAGIPVMSADPSSAEGIEVLAAHGFSYYNMGRATGRLIAEIEAGREIGSIPIQYMTDPADVDLLINLDVAERLGLTVPQALLDNANMIISGGQQQ
ncbi:ABC transporter substrate-binding protein [Spirochaeta dissipatitropha]